MSSSNDEKRGYRGEHVDRLETDMAAYNRGRMRRELDDQRARAQTDEGGGGGAIILVMGGVAVVAGAFTVLPYVVAWALALVATIIVVRLALPLDGAKVDWGDAIMGSAIAFGVGLFAVGMTIAIGSLLVSLGGPALTPVIDHLSDADQAGDMYAPYFAPGYYLIVGAIWKLIGVGLVWAFVTGRWLHKCLPDGRMSATMRTIAFGLLALVTYALAMIPAAKWLPGHFYYDYRDYLVEEVTSADIPAPATSA